MLSVHHKCYCISNFDYGSFVVSVLLHKDRILSQQKMKWWVILLIMMIMMMNSMFLDLVKDGSDWDGIKIIVLASMKSSDICARR